MKEEEVIFCAIEVDKKYNLCAVIGEGNIGYKVGLNVNLLDIIDRIMKCTLKAANVSYTKGEFLKFMKKFKNFSVDGKKIVDACCVLIYIDMINQLKQENIVAVGKNSYISESINNSIVNLDKFVEYLFSNLSVKITNSLLKRSVSFLQIFSIINHRIIKANVNGREYVIADKDVINDINNINKYLLEN